VVRGKTRRRASRSAHTRRFNRPICKLFVGDARDRERRSARATHGICSAWMRVSVMRRAARERRRATATRDRGVRGAGAAIARSEEKNGDSL